MTSTFINEYGPITATCEDIAFRVQPSVDYTEKIMSETTCPDCLIEMDQIERTTFTGRDMREYQCPKCGRKQIVDCGKALWQILSEANQESDKD
jgi:predicted RNA-binding Zn-ribbon protein involved in translation (DUF1610 family)